MANGSDGFPDDPTVKRSKLAREGAPAISFALTIVDGPDKGARFLVDGQSPSRAMLGKSPACELLVTDARVSRRHAAIEVLGSRLRVTDMTSTNGTYVDGIAVGVAFLRGGETLRLGDTAIFVEQNLSPASVGTTAKSAFGALLGASPAMQRLYPLCERLAASSVPVVIEGETGTGKEQLAEALHEQSSRAAGPYVVFDCTTVAPNLIESELFGHEKGSFTGALLTREGVFERANGGTLLIDEIGDLPLELQPKLLRAIERSVVTRVGGSSAQRVDVRLLTATRRNLDREVQLGRFREDLFHRIAVTRIELPPLREREGDVPLLARYFWEQLGGDARAIPADLLARWADYDWPGNVRELRNAVARRLALGDLADMDELTPTSDPHRGEEPTRIVRGGDAIAKILSLELPLVEAREKVIEAFEQRYLEDQLARHDGNVTRAAAAAGVTRRHFQRLRSRE